MNTRFLTKYLYPFYETSIKGRQTLNYLTELDEVQWKSTAELQQLQWSRLQKLLDHAYRNSPYYTASFQHLGITPAQITSMDDFRRLPVLARADVVANIDGMIAENYRDQLFFKATGGSTGVPVRLALDRKSFEWRTAVAQRGYSWAGCEMGQHTLYLWSGDVGKPGLISKLKNRLHQLVMNRVMVNSFQFGDAEMLATLDYINKHKPTGIVAFTMPLYNFAKFIRDRGLQLDRSAVKGIVTGAEKLYDYQRELIEDVFGAKVFNTYGCREFMLMASECEKHEGLHVNIDSLVVEILVDGRPAEPGETGEVVVTDLHNYGMPFIRYKNGDLATVSNKVCSCGRGLPLIQDIDGRKLDEIIAFDGRKITGAFFPHLMKEVKEIGKFQIVQKARGLLEVRLIPNGTIAAERLSFLEAEIHKVMGPEVKVDFKLLDDIPLTASGKFRVTISELGPRPER